MERLIILILILTTSCGYKPKSTPSTIYPTGLTISTTSFTISDEAKLIDAFYETKTCVNMPRGDYHELSIEVVESAFTVNNILADGAFTTPNSIKVRNTVSVWKHEFVHYLLFENTSDPDSYHNSLLFLKCSGRPF